MYHWDKLTTDQRNQLVSEQSEWEMDYIERVLDDSFALEDATATRTIEQLMEPMVTALQATVDHFLRPEANTPRLPDWMDPVCKLGIKRTSYVFVSSLVRMFLDPAVTNGGLEGYGVTQQYFARLFATDLWEMLHFFDARDKNPEFYREQSKYFRNWEPRRRKAFARKVSDLSKWKFKKKMSFAMAMLRIAEQVNLVKLTMKYRTDRRSKKYDSVIVIELTDDVREQMDLNKADFMEKMCPTRYPMVCRPLDMTEEQVGGWRSEDMRKRATYVTGTSNDLEGEEEEVASRAPVHRHSTASRETINNLQRTEWVVNRRVLDVMWDFHVADTPVGKVPRSHNEREVLGRLEHDATNEEIAAHKAKLAAAYTDWHRAETARLQFHTLVNAGRRMIGRVFWHAWFCDFRGRFYSDAAYLNPQGDDLNKSLLLFAEPYKVSKKGIYWLMVALANEMGYDKASFDDRVRWVQERMDLWKAIDADPHGTVNEWEDDAKMKNATFCRLARIFDLMKALRTGYSQMPVNLDGSCNGVQHWAAITRDEAVAERVNLMDTPVPQDLYQFVADGCTALCHDEPNPWRVRFLDHWVDGISRKVCKRSVMCDPYGISDHSVKTYVRQEGHLDWVPKEEQSAATAEMGKLICEAKEVQMRFINHGKKFVSMLTDYYTREKREPFWWRSPNGFEVINWYPTTENIRIDTAVWDKRFEKKTCYTSKWRVETDDASPSKGAQAMPPNWIHSIDAAHMSFTVNGMVGNGIIQLSFIHDSFGCPAEDVPIMREIIKEQFHAIHLQDQLRGLLDHAEAALGYGVDDQHKLFEHYQLGGYDIGRVLDSEYVFG